MLDLLRNNYYLCPLRPQAVTYLALPSPTLSHPAWVHCLKSTRTVVFLSPYLAAHQLTVACWIVSFSLAEMLRWQLVLLHIVYSLQPKLLNRFAQWAFIYFKQCFFTCSHLYFFNIFSDVPELFLFNDNLPTSIWESGF